MPLSCNVQAIGISPKKNHPGQLDPFRQHSGILSPEQEKHRIPEEDARHKRLEPAVRRGGESAGPGRKASTEQTG